MLCAWSNMRFEELQDENDDDEWARALVKATEIAEDEEWHRLIRPAPPRARREPVVSAMSRVVSPPRVGYPPVKIPPKEDPGDLLRAAFAAYVSREDRLR
jgi:hypothetical protein